MQAVVGDYAEMKMLSGRMTQDDVSAVLADIAEYNGDDGLRGLIGQECLIMAGGLLVRDTTTGVVIEPGCCCGLEDWRDWQDLLDGGAVWLGHSPDPKLDVVDGIARMWPDEDHTDGPACELPLAELPGHLARVRGELMGFLELVRRWAPDGDELAAALDEHFRISAPL